MLTEIKSMDKCDQNVSNKENYCRESVGVEPEDHSQVCAICLDETYIGCRLTDTCEHQFCFECLFKWSKVQNLCPLCQQQYHRIDNQLASESQLNCFERILIGRIRRDTSPKNFALRKLLKSPKWKDLDRFWSRVFSTGIICKRKIVVLLLIDANKEPDSDLLQQRIKQIIDCVSRSVDDESFKKVIDALLKSRVDNIFLMTIIVCCRRISRVKK